MNAVRDWAVTVVVGAIACALVRMLVPSGRFDRTLRFVVSAFFIACLLSPFVQLGAFKLPELSPSDSALSSVEQRLAQASLDIAERRLSEQLEQSLLEKGMNVRSVSIWMDNRIDSGIEIAQVQIVLGTTDAGEAENARAEAARMLEIPPDAVVVQSG